MKSQGSCEDLSRALPVRRAHTSLCGRICPNHGMPKPQGSSRGTGNGAHPCWNEQVTHYSAAANSARNSSKLKFSQVWALAYNKTPIFDFTFSYRCPPLACIVRGFHQGANTLKLCKFEVDMRMNIILGRKSKAPLSCRTFCSDGSVLYLHCPLAICGHWAREKWLMWLKNWKLLLFNCN